MMLLYCTAIVERSSHCAIVVRSAPDPDPLELFERAILNHQSGDVVYEPFAGSGTCLIAAEKTGRRCFAVELDPAWCDVIRNRYQHYRERKAG